MKTKRLMPTSDSFIMYTSMFNQFYITETVNGSYFSRVADLRVRDMDSDEVQRFLDGFLMKAKRIKI